MTTKLYHHKTDGGAEYLCTSPVEGTDEGDLHTAIIRLDGGPELLNSYIAAASDLYAACDMAGYCLDPRNAEIVTDEDRRRTYRAIVDALEKAKGD